MSRLIRVFILLAMMGAKLSAVLPYRAEPAFGNLEFEQPLAIVAAPGETNRLFILEKPGRIMVIKDLQRPTRSLFLDLTSEVWDDDSEQGILALAFHPDFSRNRQFYVWYTSNQAGRENRLSRFLVSERDPHSADRRSELRMLSQVDDAKNHNGGELLFGADGYLYISLGDEGGAHDRFNNSQRIDRDFFAGILRIDVDQRPGSLTPNPHPAVHRGTYAIPPDNPFVGAQQFNHRPVNPAKVRTEFWAVGLRNPWRMSFDPASGALWCGDVGQDRFEEINLIVKGGNYGWNYREGTGPGSASQPRGVVLIDPVWQYPRSQGISVTGGFVCRGTRFPELEGKYLFADYVLGRVWALEPDGSRPVNETRVRQIAQSQGIASFGRDPRNGDVLLASLTSNRILRLVRNTPSSSK